MDYVRLSKVCTLVKNLMGVLLIALGFILSNEILKNIGIIWSVLKCVESCFDEFKLIRMFQDEDFQKGYMEANLKYLCKKQDGEA